MLGLIFALLLDETPNPNATPPPTIITTKSSPLCKAVREIVAPTLVAVREQDIGLGLSGQMLHGGNDITVMHLENNIDRLAQLNIQTNQLLDKLVALDLANQTEHREVNVLERHLRGIAKLQNDALNQLSGTAYTNDFLALAGYGDPMAGEAELRPHLPRTAPSFSMATGPSMEETASRNLGVLRQEIDGQEAGVAQALQPLVAHCI